jgi:hypothetical protein
MVLRKVLSCILAVTTTLGAPVLGSGPVELRSRDVVLNDGKLEGTVLNREAQPVAGLTVRLFHGESLIATTTSNERGQFSVTGLRNGGHVLAMGEDRQNVRFWGTQSAPPAAVNRVTLVVDEAVVRGQCGDACGEGSGSMLSSVMGNPAVLLLIGGGVVGVVAIAAHNNNDDQPASP